MVNWSDEVFFLQINHVEKEMILYFLYMNNGLLFNIQLQFFFVNYKNEFSQTAIKLPNPTLCLN
jgi:hypothetical protein